MSDKEQVFDGGAEVSALEVARFEELADEIAAEVAGAGVEEEDEVEAAASSANTYKTVNLIGRFCSPYGNWGTAAKNLGTVQHWNGPPTPARAWQDPIAWIKFINDLHAEEGRFSPGWRFDGVAYHEFVFNDTVYRTREYGANLPHCGNLEWNHRALGLHVAIGEGQRANAATLKTLTARHADHLAAMGLGRSQCKGHREVGSSECPGSLQGDFVLPFRAGKMEPAPTSLYRVRVAEQQAGAFREQAKATELVRRINALKCKASVVSGGGWHRAKVQTQQVGAFSSEGNAQKLISDLGKLGVKATTEGGSSVPKGIDLSRYKPTNAYGLTPHADRVRQHVMSIERLPLMDPQWHGYRAETHLPSASRTEHHTRQAVDFFSNDFAQLQRIVDYLIKHSSRDGKGIFRVGGIIFNNRQTGYDQWLGDWIPQRWRPPSGWQRDGDFGIADPYHFKHAHVLLNA